MLIYTSILFGYPQSLSLLQSIGGRSDDGHSFPDRRTGLQVAQQKTKNTRKVIMNTPKHTKWLLGHYTEEITRGCSCFCQSFTCSCLLLITVEVLALLIALSWEIQIPPLGCLKDGFLLNNFGELSRGR